MASTKLCAVLAFLAVVSTASALKWGRCNVKSLVEDFSLEEFQGVWYEVAYTDNVPVATGARCQFGEYRVSGMDKVYFKLGAVYDDDDSNTTSIIEGYASVDEKDQTLWTVQESRCK